MKGKKYFNAIEEKIIRKLHAYHVPLTIYEVAKECNISYPTAKKYLKKLHEDNIFEKIELEGKDEQYNRKSKEEKA